MRAIVAALIVVVTGACLAYPTLAHRVTGDALGYSLRRASGDGFNEPCRRSKGGWYCPHGSPEGIAYRMTVKGRCWRARSVDRRSDRGRYLRRLRGCVGLADQIRLAEYL